MAAFIESTNAAGGKKVLTAVEFAQVCSFIKKYHGLPIDCEIEMIKKGFSYIDANTIRSILSIELTNSARTNRHRLEKLARQSLKLFEDQEEGSQDTKLFVKIATMERVNPMALSRAVLQEKYKCQNKGELSRLTKYPYLIEDPMLCANVTQCLSSDIHDGPLVDLKRRIIGEEYEFKLKKMADNAGMAYYEENDLRRMGFDKTPDLKMIVPFLYKGEPVNWIESKALFGDPKTHRFYCVQQLDSYSNRFGPGLVIYWFGYHEDTPLLTENNVGITVLCDFPAKEHLDFLELSEETVPLQDQTETKMEDVES